MRGFVERAGGTMRIEGAAGRGTTVTFRLPEASAASRPQPDGDARPSNVRPVRPAAS
jgi:K+-sensing histidine kinase KdpD